jgi:hypothetical protein
MNGSLDSISWPLASSSDCSAAEYGWLKFQWVIVPSDVSSYHCRMKKNEKILIDRTFIHIKRDICYHFVQGIKLKYPKLANRRLWRPFPWLNWCTYINSVELSPFWPSSSCSEIQEPCSILFFFLRRNSPSLGLGLPPRNSPFHFGLLDLRYSVGLLERVISSSQSLYLYTNTEKRTHAHKHQTSMPWVGFEPTIPASKRAKTVHALDLSATVTGSSVSQDNKMHHRVHNSPPWDLIHA